jgi:hypothetical protein
MKNVISGMILSVIVMYTSSGYSQDLPDPTRPADFQTTLVVQDLPRELIDWKVTAIRISDSDRTAIINGQLVRTGDAIGPASIHEIQPIQVILIYDNKQVVVRLFRDVFLRKQARNAPDQ